MSLTTYQKTRVIFDLVGMSEDDFTDQVIICMPRFSWMAARTFLRGYGLRSANYSEQYLAAGYQVPDPALFNQIDASISEFLGAEDMTTSIEDGLAAIALAIDNLTAVTAICCSGGSFGAGSAEPPPATFIDDGQSTFPAGFADRAAYETAKCAAANYIVAALRADMQFLINADIVALTATVLIASLFTPIPFDDILAMLGFVVAMSLQGVLIGLAQEIIDEIDLNTQEIVCILYDADDSQAANDGLQGHFNTALSTSAALLADLYITNDGMNGLFELNTLIQGGSLTMSIDCANCHGEPCGVGIITGNYNNQGFDIHGEITINVNSDQFNVTGCGPRYREYMQITPPSLIEVVGSTLDGNCADPHIWRSSPLNNATSGWDIDGLPPIDSAAHLVGTISLHSLCQCQIELICRE